MAAAFINSIILLILKEKNEMNWMNCWWPAAKKSNSSIPSTIDSNFHKFPSIIEVLSLFDSFNYCYNILLVHFNSIKIEFHEQKEKKFNFFCFGEMKWELIEWLPGSSLIDFINGCEQLVIGLTPEQLKSTLSFISLFINSIKKQTHSLLVLLKLFGLWVCWVKKVKLIKVDWIKEWKQMERIDWVDGWGQNI